METKDLNREELHKWNNNKTILDELYLEDEIHWKQRSRDK
jgi:hypothetical protein